MNVWMYVLCNRPQVLQAHFSRIGLLCEDRLAQPDTWHIELDRRVQHRPNLTKNCSLKMESYVNILWKPSPNFFREIAPKVLLVGLGSVLFRDAPYIHFTRSLHWRQTDRLVRRSCTHTSRSRWMESIRVFSCASNGNGIWYFTTRLATLQTSLFHQGSGWTSRSAREPCHQ